MSHKILQCCRQFAIAALIALCGFASSPFAAGQVAAATSRANAAQISATYEVQQRTSLGAQEQIRMRIHLVNHGSSSWSVKRMTLWDFSRPERGATRTTAIALASHASADTIQEFTVRSADYQLWQQGTPPRLMLQVVGARNTASKTVVRLDRAAQEVN
jgi:hypothetical protein